MSPRATLLILAVMGGLLTGLSTYIDVSHWLNTSCNMASHNPIMLPIAWASWLIFTYVTWLNSKSGISTYTALYWFLIVIWGVGNIYYSGCMVSYWI